MNSRIPPEEYEKSGHEFLISESLLEKYHTADELERFYEWSSSTTQMLSHGQVAYFPVDYEKWLELGMPET